MSATSYEMGYLVHTSLKAIYEKIEEQTQDESNGPDDGLKLAQLRALKSCFLVRGDKVGLDAEKYRRTSDKILKSYHGDMQKLDEPFSKIFIELNKLLTHYYDTSAIQTKFYAKHNSHTFKAAPRIIAVQRWDNIVEPMIEIIQSSTLNDTPLLLSPKLLFLIKSLFSTLDYDYIESMMFKLLTIGLNPFQNITIRKEVLTPDGDIEKVVISTSVYQELAESDLNIGILFVILATYLNGRLAGHELLMTSLLNQSITGSSQAWSWLVIGGTTDKVVRVGKEMSMRDFMFKTKRSHHERKAYKFLENIAQTCSGEKTNYRDSYLYRMVYKGREELVFALLALGMRVDDGDNSNILHLAIRQNFSPETIRKLLNAGAVIDAREYNDHELTMIVKCITPLHQAVMCRNKSCVEMLLRFKPDPSIKNGASVTPLQLAEKVGLPEIAQLLRQYEEQYEQEQHSHVRSLPA